jgi:ACT domain-containing protein
MLSADSYRMANEELIYRITRAVYARLGEDADERAVEALVMDVYRAVEPFAGAEGGARASSGESEGRSDRLIISVFGVDHPGIVAGVSQVLAEARCSIADINQTVVSGKFAMVIVADISQAQESAAALKDRFRREGERLGVRIYAQREDLFNAMHRI